MSMRSSKEPRRDSAPKTSNIPPKIKKLLEKGPLFALSGWEQHHRYGRGKSNMTLPDDFSIQNLGGHKAELLRKKQGAAQGGNGVLPDRAASDQNGRISLPPRLLSALNQTHFPDFESGNAHPKTPRNHETARAALGVHKLSFSDKEYDWTSHPSLTHPKAQRDVVVFEQALASSPERGPPAQHKARPRAAGMTNLKKSHTFSIGHGESGRTTPVSNGIPRVDAHGRRLNRAERPLEASGFQAKYARQLSENSASSKSSNEVSPDSLLFKSKSFSYNDGHVQSASRPQVVVSQRILNDSHGQKARQIQEHVSSRHLQKPQMDVIQRSHGSSGARQRAEPSKSVSSYPTSNKQQFLRTNTADIPGSSSTHRVHEKASESEDEDTVTVGYLRSRSLMDDYTLRNSMEDEQHHQYVDDGYDDEDLMQDDDFEYYLEFGKNGRKGKFTVSVAKEADSQTAIAESDLRPIVTAKPIFSAQETSKLSCSGREGMGRREQLPEYVYVTLDESRNLSPRFLANRSKTLTVESRERTEPFAGARKPLKSALKSSTLGGSSQVNHGSVRSPGLDDRAGGLPPKSRTPAAMADDGNVLFSLLSRPHERNSSMDSQRVASEACQAVHQSDSGVWSRTSSLNSESSKRSQRRTSFDSSELVRVSQKDPAKGMKGQPKPGHPLSERAGSQSRDKSNAAIDHGRSREASSREPTPPHGSFDISSFPWLPKPSGTHKLVPCQHCPCKLLVPPDLQLSTKGIQKLRCAKCREISLFRVPLPGTALVEGQVAASGDSGKSLKGLHDSRERRIIV